MAESGLSLEAQVPPFEAGFEAELNTEGDPSLHVRKGADASLEFSLTLMWNHEDLVPGSTLVESLQRPVIEEFDLLCGKAATHHRALHLEHTFTFVHPSAGQWQLIVRESDDGVAFRYRVPSADGDLGQAGGRITLRPEARLWYQEYQTWYENPLHGAWADEVVEQQLGLPVLVHVGEQYLLIAESDIDHTGTGSHLSAILRGEGLVLDFEPADATLRVGGGTLTPWRVALGGTLAAVVESSFIDELARPGDEPVPTWIHPGPAVWSWWSDHYSGSQPAAQRRFIDFAAEIGWRHVLVDCGWVDDWVPALVSYASFVGVQVHLWCRWTDVETPEQRRALGRWAAWGVAGIKVDFMESEANERYRWYEELLKETYRVGLMVNLHGSVIPRGWARRWPHLLSYEAVRANEYYSFYGEPIPTTHHVILPFTRNVLGSMDFTPVAINTAMRDTTEGGEAATLVLFECGLTHLADDPDIYRERPSLMKLLRCLPDSWEDTILLDGHPDTHVVLARRSGETWFIAGTSAVDRQVRVPLQRLGGSRSLWLLTDHDGALRDRLIEVAGDCLELELSAGGGFVAAVGGLPPVRRASVVAITTAIQSDLILDAEHEAVLDVDGTLTVTVEPGWKTIALGGGRWLLRAPGDVPGVVTLRGSDGCVAHAQVHPPLAGSTRLSTLPFSTFSNAFGPVERDQSNGGGNPNDGQPMSIAGQRFDHGLGSSAPSSVTFFLGGQASRFAALVGVDDETPAGRAMVQVMADGRALAELEIEGGRAAVAIDVDIAGAQTLTLVSEAQSAATRTHVDWAEAVVTTDEDTGWAPMPTSSTRKESHE